MIEKRTTIKAPKNDYTWPENKLIQIGAAIDSGTGHRHAVFMDGTEIGFVESRQERPSERVPGTRLRHDLPPRLAWKATRGTGANGSSRPSYTARIKAIRALILDHIQKTETTMH